VAHAGSADSNDNFAGLGLSDVDGLDFEVLSLLGEDGGLAFHGLALSR
jgi:hypothetical protein